ncbi:hypothetical protein [Alcanivorax jadensis]|uniref:hypothetical protein n=1 Tax=Alcanivorax jadensis TaxID=64988 RepID=UPI0026E9E67F|nr:hypothetical protein [Alcanivorax jadensis]
MDPLFHAGKVFAQGALGGTGDGKKSLTSWDAIKHELKCQGKTEVLRKREEALEQGQKIKALKLAKANERLL